jgi:pimeloyl-ACP methyl ester carboxylesterase
MVTFVIVHDAWSGAHAWRWVRPLLRAAGHEVFTPALTGLGERSHLASAQVDLETHIRDVVGMLEYEDLGEVVLVGHSYGGMVITGVADRIPERLAQLVYLDAEVPMDGQSELDLLPPDERAGYEKAPDLRGRGGRSLRPAGAAAGRPGPKGALGNGADGPQPLATFAPTAAADEPGGPTGVPRLCAVHSRQGRPRAARVRPARPIGAGVAIRGARGRAQRPRDRARGTRRRAGSARAAWVSGEPGQKLVWCQKRSIELVVNEDSSAAWQSEGNPPQHCQSRCLNRPPKLKCRGGFRAPSVIPLVIPPGTTPHDQAVSAGWHTRLDQRERHTAIRRGQSWVDFLSVRCRFESCQGRKGAGHRPLGGPLCGPWSCRSFLRRRWSELRHGMSRRHKQMRTRS